MISVHHICLAIFDRPPAGAGRVRQSSYNKDLFASESIKAISIRTPFWSRIHHSLFTIRTLLYKVHQSPYNKAIVFDLELITILKIKTWKGIFSQNPSMFPKSQIWWPSLRQSFFINRFCDAPDVLALEDVSHPEPPDLFRHEKVQLVKPLSIGFGNLSTDKREPYYILTIPRDQFLLHALQHPRLFNNVTQFKLSIWRGTNNRVPFCQSWALAEFWIFQ